jgi:hypothetical protein
MATTQPTDQVIDPALSGKLERAKARAIRAVIGNERDVEQTKRLLRILLVMITFGGIAYWPGLWAFERVFPIGAGREGEAGPSLVVCAEFAVATAIAFINVRRAKSDRIRVWVPRNLDPWVKAIAAIATGILIATTIFH